MLQVKELLIEISYRNHKKKNEGGKVIIYYATCFKPKQTTNIEKKLKNKKQLLMCKNAKFKHEIQIKF